MNAFMIYGIINICIAIVIVEMVEYGTHLDMNGSESIKTNFELFKIIYYSLIESPRLKCGCDSMFKNSIFFNTDNGCKQIIYLHASIVRFCDINIKFSFIDYLRYRVWIKREYKRLQSISFAENNIKRCIIENSTNNRSYKYNAWYR